MMSGVVSPLQRDGHCRERSSIAAKSFEAGKGVSDRQSLLLGCAALSAIQKSALNYQSQKQLGSNELTIEVYAGAFKRGSRTAAHQLQHCTAEDSAVSFR